MSIVNIYVLGSTLRCPFKTMSLSRWMGLGRFWPSINHLGLTRIENYERWRLWSGRMFLGLFYKRLITVAWFICKLEIIISISIVYYWSHSTSRIYYRATLSLVRLINDICKGHLGTFVVCWTLQFLPFHQKLLFD